MGSGVTLHSVATSFDLLTHALSITYYTNQLFSHMKGRPKYADYYRLRLEMGSNADAGGHPPSVILTDFSGVEFYGVFEGTSTDPTDMCRNNENVSRGFLNFGGKHKFDGLTSAEAPRHDFETKNGFHLKSIDIQAGSHAICVSSLVIKGGETQARPDQVFVPIGDLGYLCGKEWNWGANIGNRRQRCLWIDGNPSKGRKTIQTLHLDMEKIPQYFDIKTDKDLKNLTLSTVCSLFGDSSGYAPDRNSCQKSGEKVFGLKNMARRRPLLIEANSKDLQGDSLFMDNFYGAGFITMDNKVYDIRSNKFKDVSGKNLNKISPASDSIDKNTTTKSKLRDRGKLWKKT